MPFKPTNEDLLGEQYRIMDELAVLGTERRSLTVRLERVRERISALRQRNGDICWELSPERKRGTVTRVDFINRLRFKSTAYEQAA